MGKPNGYTAASSNANPTIQALYNLGVLRIRQGQLDEAIALFERALDRQSAFPEAHYV